MKTLKITLLAAAATLAMGGAAAAQESPVSFNLGVASDYVYRGVSQTDEGPQVFGGVDLAIGEMGYAGIWASNVDFGDDTVAEVDFYAGVTPTLGIASMDFGVIYYAYVDAPSGSDYNFWEFSAAGSVPAGPAEIGAAIYYSPEFFGGTGDAFYYEVNAAAPLTERLSVSGALGRQELDGGGDYTTWNIGLGFAINDTIGVDVRYHDTDEDSLGKIGEGRVAASLTAAF
ncbi:TorF family putative porin [Phenylobacterium sp.]|uniref:TorF family putative porin n=1 Tax=Phenylobacterium sp. TaxID=1871053 RepID=UPI0027301056|nr:TorF family putative porin [Phenylobacterium sp.]MDP1875903.1 TorF family putative porin [Phenylobacterium sp.]